MNYSWSWNIFFKKPYLYQRGIGMVFHISLILTKTISIPVWYRYGFLVFFAVFNTTSAQAHIFDSYTRDSIPVEVFFSKISKKPYLYQSGIDMVFSIFSLSNFLLETQRRSESRSLMFTRAHGHVNWYDIIYTKTA